MAGERKRLTANEIEAVITLLNERLAGGDEDIRDALGCSQEEAELLVARAISAIDKLSDRLKRGGSDEQGGR